MVITRWASSQVDGLVVNSGKVLKCSVLSQLEQFDVGVTERASIGAQGVEKGGEYTTEDLSGEGLYTNTIKL